MKSLQQLKQEWDELDKSNFETLELEYKEDEPLYINLKKMAEEANMTVEDLISKLIIEYFEHCHEEEKKPKSQ